MCLRHSDQSCRAAPKLLDRLRLALAQQQQHRAPEQIETVVGSVTAFIRYHSMRHPRELGPEHVANFPAHVREQPSAATVPEVQAREALSYLYEQFLPADVEPVPPAKASGSGPTRSPFLNRCHEVLRLRHYAIRTEECYVQWIRRFIRFHCSRHPAEMGTREIEAYLTHLAVQRNVSAFMMWTWGAVRS